MRILLVEDERPLAEVIRRGLSREGFVVDVHHDGQDGLWAASESVYDAIVLDIMLPSLDGYQVVERLRDAGVWTPTLMLTAVDGELDEAEAFALGADDYLTKPFSFVVLVARLHALIRRGAPQRPVVMTAGSLSVDPARRRAHRDGVEISLTAKEFTLLTYFMRRVGEVVTKTAILEAVWDPAYDGDVNIVEVYVGYLRRKIDAPFSVSSIETVRGAGYRLLATPSD